MRTLTNVSAIPYSTFRFDASLGTVIECNSIDDLQRLDIDTAPIILGEGSNTIFMQDITRPICRYVASTKTVTDLGQHHVLLHVDAGHNWHQLVTWAVQQQFWGIENLALIPGSVGAAPVQNIGAYGVELADSCLYVDFYHWQTKSVQRIAAGRCDFGYRDSIFKHALSGKGVIVAVGFCLSKRSKPVLAYKGLDHLAADVSLMSVYQQVIAVRGSKLPDPAKLANCGSFFKNPVITKAKYLNLLANFPNMPGFDLGNDLIKLPAAWLIEQQGFKGSKHGEVGCYNMQPLVLVNYGNGTSQQLNFLIARIQQKVSASYAVTLEPEVRMLHDNGSNND